MATLTMPVPAPARTRRRLGPGVAVAVIAIVAMAATILAMRRTSPTFDEIVLVSGGARGFHTGRFDMAPDHPPLMQYVYGLPVYLSQPHYPTEKVGSDPPAPYRYLYAQAFYYGGPNDPERVSFLGRLPAALLVLLLVLATYAFARPRIGPWGGLLAATLIAFMPDVLAHGGVAYNDLPLALGYLLSVWALDAAVRAPSLRTGALAGLAVALTVAAKFSGGGVLVAGLVLLALEAVVRRRDPAWRRRIGLAVLAAAAAGYLTLVLVYRGDFALAQMRYGLAFTLRHVSEGHGAAAYLAGRTSPVGWWYFFPVAFLFKTPAALHLLTLLALGGAIASFRQHGTDRSTSWLTGPLRPAWVALVVFGAFLLLSHLDIGFRYALPALAPLSVLVACGIVKLWPRGGRLVRWAIPALVLWFAVSSLSFYPNFLAYTSEYGPGRDRGDELLVDSSLDWGQGLLQLREWMREERVPRVYLAYFGSALPAAFGIDYVPLRSVQYLPRPRAERPGEAEPRFAVISATLLHPVYLRSDPYAQFRELRPYRVIAHDLFVYKLRD